MVRFLFLLLFVSCGSMETKVLLDGSTKIPLDDNFFNKNYRKNATVKLIEGVDYNSIYVGGYYRDHYEVLKSNFDNKDRAYLNVLKFYENGCVNLFFFKKSDVLSDKIPQLNPENSGNRGVCYSNGGENKLAIFTIVSENLKRGIYSATIGVNGDSLFVKREDENFTAIYIKKQLPKKNKKYTANW